MRTKIGVFKDRLTTARIAVVLAVVLASSCVVSWGQVPRSGTQPAVRRQPAGYTSEQQRRAQQEEAEARQRGVQEQEAWRAQQLQNQNAAARAGYAAIVRQLQAITNRAYADIPPPVDPRRRIVAGKFYDPPPGPGWGEAADMAVPRVSVNYRYVVLEVDSIGPTGVVCLVRENESGLPPSWVQEFGAVLKRIVIFNHPQHSTLTTDQIMGSCIARRASNWRTNGVSLEAYDCGLSDTVANRQKLGIPVPTPEQVEKAQKEIAAAVEQLSEQRLVAKAQADDAKAEAKKAAQAKHFALYQEHAQGGDGLSQLQLGEMYLRGEGVEANTALARQWLSAALTNGYARATDLLAEIESGGAKQ